METKNHLTIGQSIFLVLICFNLQLLGGMIFAYNIRSKSSHAPDMIFILSFISILLTILAGLHFSKTPLREYFSKTHFDVLNTVYVLLMVVGAYILILAFNMLLYKYIQGFRSTPQVLLSAYGSIIGILHITTAGPVAEEILFRGIILRGLLKNCSITKSIIVSSVLFGILHFNIVQSLVTTTLGLMLGWIFIKSGSLWICIISHMVYNSLTIISPHMLMLYNRFELILPLTSVVGAALTVYAIYNLLQVPSNISHIFNDDNLV